MMAFKRMPVACAFLWSAVPDDDPAMEATATRSAAAQSVSTIGAAELSVQLLTSSPCW
jgi:hypothetical protein